MFVLFKLLLSLGAALATYVLWRLLSILTRPYGSTLRDLPGPPPLHWLYGHLQELSSHDNTSHEVWIETYGSTAKYKGFLGSDILLTADTRAISHIINHTDIYQKSEYNRFVTSVVLGNNVVTLEGEEHRRQRRIMNPAFGPAQIRDLTEIFVNKSCEVRDIWASRIIDSGKDAARIDTYSDLLKMTLDVIGLAGFNYEFKSLSGGEQPDSLHKAYSDLRRQTISGLKIYFIIWYLFPLSRKAPSSVQRATDKAVLEMRSIGTRLLAAMKRDVMEAQKAQTAHTQVQLDVNATPDTLPNRALLTLLVQANMRPDLPKSQRLSDNDVIDQIRTFLVAGHETTSNATAWCLHALSQAPEVQQKLRDELWALPSDNPTMDELQALPYLDMVVRETLRMYTPVPSIQRIAMKDDVIPLETPVTDIHGKTHREIRMPKGTAVDVPILALNRSKAIWGEDALEFRPDRWESIPEAAKRIPGVWGNLMTFLGGPRACIGYRFSLVEIKALLLILIRAFEFEMAVPADRILKGSAGIVRPTVRGEEEKGPQMPLMVRLHKHGERQPPQAYA